MPHSFCHSHAAKKPRRVCLMLGPCQLWNSTHQDRMSLLRWHEYLLSALSASFFSESNSAPRALLAFFLPGSCKEKAAGQRISALGDEWAYAGCSPVYLTLSPQRVFTCSLHPPGPAALCGYVRSGLIRWKQWRREVRRCMTACHWWLQMRRSVQARTTTPPPYILRSPVHPARAWMPIFSASCLMLWKSWVWNGLPQRNRPVAAWKKDSCRDISRPLVNEHLHSFQRSTMRSPNLGVHPIRPAYVPLLPPPSLQSRKRIPQPASPGWVSGHVSTASCWKAKATHGRSMASLVVLECHLWLNLTEMKDADKVPVLDSPVSPTCLFDPASQPHRIRRRQCDTSCPSAPALQLLLVAPRWHDSAVSERRATSCSASRQEEERAKSRCSWTTPPKDSVMPGLLFLNPLRLRTAECLWKILLWKFGAFPYRPHSQSLL